MIKYEVKIRRQVKVAFRASSSDVQSYRDNTWVCSPKGLEKL